MQRSGQNMHGLESAFPEAPDSCSPGFDNDLDTLADRRSCYGARSPLKGALPWPACVVADLPDGADVIRKMDDARDDAGELDVVHGPR